MVKKSKDSRRRENPRKIELRVTAHKLDLGASGCKMAGPQAYSCGYCHSKEDTALSFGMQAVVMSCQAYQDLIDRGWRRSGMYLYKPDLKESCCACYTIRLDVTKYQQSKSHNKVLKKVHKYLYCDEWECALADGEDELEKGAGVSSRDNHPNAAMHKKGCVEKSETTNQRHSKDDELSSPRASRSDKRKPTPIPINSHSLLTDSEINGPAHRLEIVTTRAAFERQTFDLYKKYQIAVHKDPPSKLTESSYKRFLVASPLDFEAPRQPHLPGYGSFHQKYYIDGTLAIVAVIDILPKCVSSVYLMYDPDFAFLSCGVYSVLREIAYAKTLSTSLPELKYYYMGFYIHTCPKMNYKGSYKPSDLLCPELFVWVPLSRCIPELGKTKYVKLSDLLSGEELAEEQKDQDARTPLGTTIPDTDIDKVRIMTKSRVFPFESSTVSADETWRVLFADMLRNIGPVVSQELTLQFL
ncbi:hypothetical protein SeLEV6574_g04528 [Synchytrium endobioticum]|uniref:Arginyl-tRNA--protein transferase 1 n=1 Tax=Synchytrium endobioticum TaxID=286115 RepID=A0A507CZ04_9FUNG|nr:hypothetical protein SeLEV6574_g04528 [Synchytrium endobioticum]